MSTTNVVVTFSEPVNGVDQTTFTVSSAGGDVLGTVDVPADRLSATFDPNVSLANETLYTVTVAASITDDAVNPMGD